MLDSDEYGNPRTGQPITRYNWLGGKQRSSETLTGLVLMGVRLYNARNGLFLSMDPVYGGNATAHNYVYGDPLNKYDLDGRWCLLGKRKGGGCRGGRTWNKGVSFAHRHRVGLAAGAAGVACGMVSFGMAGVACAVGVGMLAGGVAKKWGNRKATWGHVGRAAIYGGGTSSLGFGLGAGARYGAGRALVRWFPRGGRHAKQFRSHRRSRSFRW